MSADKDDGGFQSRSARIELKWADGKGAGRDGKYPFRLGVGELRQLQEATNHGPRSIASRIARGEEFIDEVRDTIRLGLIGEGMEPLKALALVEYYVDGRPYVESCPVAQAVLFACIVGAPEEIIEDDDTSKKATAATQSENSQTGSSASPQSTPQAMPSEAL